MQYKLYGMSPCCEIIVFDPCIMFYMLLAAFSMGYLTLSQKIVITHLKLEHTNHLPNKIELAISMKKIMILSNISVVASLANGSHGIVMEIILDTREPWESVPATT
jgi:hypothetical protein